MRRILILLPLILLTGQLYPQDKAIQQFLSDTCLKHASVSICIRDADSGEIVTDYNGGVSLSPASVLKLITTGVALELLGPCHSFRTQIGYSGTLGHNGRLKGDLIIRGGGDPALGSKYFPDHYGDIFGRWVSEIRQKGIRKVDGRVITDDSYYDYLPVPSKWQWEDIGNYYGAGVYGLSIFDNSIEIHLQSSVTDSSVIISGINPQAYRYDFKNMLMSAGETDEGYVFAAPYNHYGWLTGSIPAGKEDFILNGSIADPPLLASRLLNEKLENSGIKIREEPTSVRLEGIDGNNMTEIISEINSPPLSEIIEVLNHESVNIFAETLLKEMGKTIKHDGSTAAGVSIVEEYLSNAGIASDGIFIEDGSGLSHGNSINSEALTSFLVYMRNKGRYSDIFYESLPAAGREGTLRSFFRDPVYEEAELRAKSGSMTRVRCYAGYFTSRSGRNMVFSILVNNFDGPSVNVISGIEEIIREIILHI